MRTYNRKDEDVRKISIETNTMINSNGSCLIKVGNTHVLCSCNIEDSVPAFLRKTGKGWVTAEYNMLPGSSLPRTRREGIHGKPGRTHEIQRLISRSMRMAVDLRCLREKSLIIDCDVINADGGTRTASITGGYIAMFLAVNQLVREKIIIKYPIMYQVAAVSCGIHNNKILVDLDYQEDSDADVDANFVFRRTGDVTEITEIQISAEKKSLTSDQLNEMLSLANKAINQVFDAQNYCILQLNKLFSKN